VPDQTHKVTQTSSNNNDTEKSTIKKKFKNSCLHWSTVGYFTARKLGFRPEAKPSDAVV
jgi:hypothetical protein